MSTYRQTRGGLNDLRKALRKGQMTFYSEEESTTPIRKSYYREWTFKRTKLGYWKHVDSVMDPDGVLGRFGPLYDTKPSGMENLLGKSRNAGRPELKMSRRERKLAGR